MCMNDLHVCMYVHKHAWCPWRPAGGVGSPGTGITGSCEPPCGCPEWNASPLQRHQELFTADLPL